MQKSTTLMAGKFGSRNFGTKPYLRDAFLRTGAAKPQALYIGAASGDNRGFGTMLITMLKLSGASKVHWPKLAGKKKEGALARELLEKIDLVFIGGGDVEVGMAHMRESELVEPIHAAQARGVVFTAMSAGAIMLGERWIRWPGEEASDDDAETYPCLGVVPFSLDTHGEADGWTETQSFAAVRARETKAVAHVYGIPSGGALVVESGKPQAHGVPAQVFSASPGKKAHALTDLPVPT
jgi:peptidase E